MLIKQPFKIAHTDVRVSQEPLSGAKTVHQFVQKSNGSVDDAG